MTHDSSWLARYPTMFLVQTGCRQRCQVFTLRKNRCFLCQGDWYETFDRCDRLFCRRRWMCVLLHPWIRSQPGFRSSDLERFRKTSEHFWTTKYALALSRIHFKSLRVGSIDDWFEVHCLMSRYLCTYPSTTCANLAGLCSDLQTQVKMDTYYKINGNFRILKWRYCTI